VLDKGENLKGEILATYTRGTLQSVTFRYPNANETEFLLNDLRSIEATQPDGSIHYYEKRRYKSTSLEQKLPI
jgi:hypothetical protein